MIYVIKVTTNKEDQAVSLITNRVEKKKLEVYSIIRPHGMKGYVILECLDHETAELAVYNLPYVKKVLPQNLDFKEIEQTVTPIAEQINIEKGDIVEMLKEPFKREKAKVIRINKEKEEVVVELLEAAVKIPITVRLDDVKVIRRVKEEESSSDDED